MKAITLWEPWASLIRTGAKHNETRGWATTYRGPLLICAGRTGLSDRQINEFLGDPYFQAGLAPLLGHPIDYSRLDDKGVRINHLMRGYAVAKVNLYHCMATSALEQNKIEIPKAEREFGDYNPGRYVWFFNDIHPVKPFRVRGSQGIFRVPDVHVQVEKLDIKRPEFYP